MKVYSKHKMVGLRILGRRSKANGNMCALVLGKAVFSLFKDLFVRILQETELERQNSPGELSVFQGSCWGSVGKQLDRERSSRSWWTAK